jgi:hypothetical protein
MFQSSAYNYKPHSPKQGCKQHNTSLDTEWKFKDLINNDTDILDNSFSGYLSVWFWEKNFKLQRAVSWMKSIY